MAKVTYFYFCKMMVVLSVRGAKNTQKHDNLYYFHSFVLVRNLVYFITKYFCYFPFSYLPCWASVMLCSRLLYLINKESVVKIQKNISKKPSYLVLFMKLQHALFVHAHAFTCTRLLRRAGWITLGGTKHQQTKTAN